MKNFVISEVLANKILAYLVQRPFGEVFQMVLELKDIKLFDPQTPVEVPEVEVVQG